MAVSDWRHTIIDLTNDTDDDDDEADALHVPRLIVRLPVASRPSPATTPSVNRVPLPGSTSRNVAHSANTPTTNKQVPIALTPPTSSSRKPIGASSAGMGLSNTVPKNHAPVVNNAQDGRKTDSSAERARKRMKLSLPGQQTPARPTHLGHGTGAGSAPLKSTTPHNEQENRYGRNQREGDTTRVQPEPTSGRTPQTPATARTVQKAPPVPSVQYMNEALKTGSTSIPFLDEVSTGGPRTLQIGRMTQGPESTGVIGPDRIPRTPAPNARLPASPQVHTVPQARPQRLDSTHLQKPAKVPVSEKKVQTWTTRQTQAIGHASASTSNMDRATSSRQNNLTAPIRFSGPMNSAQDEDEDSVMSDVSSTELRATQKPESRNVHVPDPKFAGMLLPRAAPIPSPRTAPISQSMVDSPRHPSMAKKFTNQFTKEESHFLIFLKEVKQLKWQEITAEYNQEFPSRTYATLQSHYSTTLNKRDRAQDPITLELPPRYTSEARIDWQTVHSKHRGPRARAELKDPYRDSPPVKFPIRQTTEHDYSSGTDSGPRRERSRRTQRINYTLGMNRRQVNGDETDEQEELEATLENWANNDALPRSETPSEDIADAPNTAIAVDNDPMNVDVEAEDAEMALKACKTSLRAPIERLPYLAALQRLSAKSPPPEWAWEQVCSRDWQGSLLHVDFSPNEVDMVVEALSKIHESAKGSSSRTRRRALRDMLSDITEPKLLRLVSQLRRDLPSRDKSSIRAFLQDAKAGKILEVPRIYRLAAARPDNRFSSFQKQSTASLLRQRELGCQSRRGWQTASSTLTYTVKDKYMDSMGPLASWTGASSDIHAVAWAPSGEYFAAAAVAVDDPDSMQYNRPNNLLYGDMAHNTIHELGAHSRKRQKTEKGANSTHAMFMSQHPRVYNTVSSVAFSTSGKLLYSAGYDETVCIWHTDNDNAQPSLGARLNVRAQLDMLTVSPKDDGVLAVAAKITENKAIRLLTVNPEDPSQFLKVNFHSSKAVSRSDLKILPTALQFEPSYGELLLAGFGANVRDSGFDTTGDLCLWDVKTEKQIPIHGSNRNVFDIEFNPYRRYMPAFAAGCVAGGIVNRGVRSLLRLYDLNGPNKYSCPLEIECKALDMNDVVWCPYDEYLIAAGCTDGRAYVWDMRWPTDPIRTLSHGQSLMPLEDGKKHEVTDTGVRFLSWGQNATRLYSGSSDGIVKVWDVTRAEENTFIKDLATFDSGIMSGAFSPDMSKLVLGEVNGSVNILEVGRDDCSMRDATRLRYVPYEDEEDDLTDSTMGASRPQADSGVLEGQQLLQSAQLQVAPMGSLPLRQVVQGSKYTGPYDDGVDAPFLRGQALKFQLSLAAPPGPQCDIATCKESFNKITCEELGDSGRSADRIPNELRRAWTATDQTSRMVVGKSKCMYCERPARPSSFESEIADTPILCERCSFACLRCGAPNPIAAATTTLICDSCAGVWDIGALGFECVQQPIAAKRQLPVPLLKKFGKESYLEKLEEVDATFGDEMNALTDYYYSLAIDRPESPPL